MVLASSGGTRVSKTLSHSHPHTHLMVDLADPQTLVSRLHTRTKCTLCEFSPRGTHCDVCSRTGNIWLRGTVAPCALPEKSRQAGASMQRASSRP